MFINNFIQPNDFGGFCNACPANTIYSLKLLT